MKQLGAADRAHLDQYLTSLRELEQQLDLQLHKPAPLAACSLPAKPQDTLLAAKSVRSPPTIGCLRRSWPMRWRATRRASSM